MSGGFTGQRVPEEAVERDRGSLFSIVHLRVSIFCSSHYPEVRETSVLLHEVDENLRGTLQESFLLTNLLPLLTRILVEYKFTLVFFSLLGRLNRHRQV